MRELLDFVTEFLGENKALEIIKIDVKTLSDFTDNMVIATGKSARQVRSLSQNLINHCKGHEVKVLGNEVNDYWALIDLGEVVIHIMQPDAREYYQLEKLWQQ